VLASSESHTSAGKAFAAFDRSLDQAAQGPKWLNDARIAQFVVDTLLAGEQERNFYRLRAWVIMPNHVHVLWLPQVPIPSITRWLKGSTARKANLLLCRTGSCLWQDESYDHWVRTADELEKIVRYIESNPVRAGFVATPEAWRWSSARQAGETACPTRGS
jgi:type I restriction enzyme R subunit/putative DNA methylase